MTAPTESAPTGTTPPTRTAPTGGAATGGAPADLARGRLLPGAAGALLSALVVVAALLAALAPGLVAGDDPYASDYATALRPPYAHAWFGTDELGRDVFARVVHGARSSLLIGVGATALAALIGVVFGLAAATLGRLVDLVVVRLADLVMAFPTLLFALVVIALIGGGRTNILLSIAFATAPVFVRLVRSRVVVTARAEFVSALRLLGIGRFRLFARHVLPNALGPLLVVATTGVGNALIIGSGLSFLGMGAVPPEPEWGLLLANARNQLAHGWWLVVFPGLSITAVVVAFTVLGRWVRARSHGAEA